MNALAQLTVYPLQIEATCKVKVDPPRIDTLKQIDEATMWQTATRWVDEHSRLIGEIAGKRGRQVMNNDDLLQHAYLIGFKTLEYCKKDGRLELFVGRFVIIFRRTLNCEYLDASLGFLDYCENIEERHYQFCISSRVDSPEQLLISQEEEALAAQVRAEKIKKALDAMTSRQRAFWGVLLHERGVATIADGAKAFGLSKKNGIELYHRSIKRARRTLC